MTRPSTDDPVGTAAPEAARSHLDAAAPSRRVRKKQQTREALIRAGLRLFHDVGYDRTAIREITDAVDVSERTFFRYFANKEDLAVSFLADGMDVFTRELAARPPTEPPVLAMRNAFRRTLEHVDVTGDGCADEPSYLAAVRVIDCTPPLLAAALRCLTSYDDTVAAVFARREGVDPATDPRPRLLAAVFRALLSLAHHDWRTKGHTGGPALFAAFDTYASRLDAALAGHWRPARGPVDDRAGGP